MKGDFGQYVDRVLDGSTLYFRLKKNKSYIESACCFVVRKHLLQENGISFVENAIHEDVVFTPMVFNYARRCMQIQDQCYMRTVHSNSIMTTTNKAKQRVSFVLFLKLISEIKCSPIIEDLKKMMEAKVNK